MNLYIYYRISDKGQPKDKLPNADKWKCLTNAVSEFRDEHFHVIADNCEPETVKIIRKICEDSGVAYTIEETALGNAASFIYMVDKIVLNHNLSDAVYLLEDDYIHRSGSKKILLEGINIADYVTLYDHPDKYFIESEGGNPFNYKQLQKTRIYLTESTHWREINSTTMTFACLVQTLRDDYHIWKK
jgi:hypothetical protein